MLIAQEISIGFTNNRVDTAAEVATQSVALILLMKSIDKGALGIIGGTHRLYQGGEHWS